MLIQIIEDDRALSEGIALALREPGMEFVQSMTVHAAREAFGKRMPELLILDVNLSDGSGYDYLRWVRERAQVPVLILTANDMEMDEVMGLTLGADDYMTKPFSLAVLRARIKALIRRGSSAPSDVFEDGEFYFDFGKLIFIRSGREISLSVNEQRLLRLLVENRERVLTRSILVDRLWSGGGEYVDENALSVTVNRLRSKLGDKKDSAACIRTVYGQGYMWKRE
ncbi:MAG: response regulator transcription factor [Lachnospiraceae bacterium]